MINQARDSQKKNFQASEERYHRLLKSITDYIYTVTIKNGKPASTFHGPGCANVTGYTTQDYENDQNIWYRMIYEEDRKNVIDQAALALKGISAAPIEHRIIHKDGSIRWIRNALVVRKDDEGRLTGYDGLITDITARRHTEEKLRESEAKYRLLFDHVPAGVCHVDLNGKFVYVNDVLCRMLEIKSEEILKKVFRDFIHPDQVARVWALFQEAVRTGKLPKPYHEAKCITASGKIIDVVMTNTTFEENGRFIGFQTMLQDVTERRKIEEIMREQSAAMKAAIDGMAIHNSKVEFVYLNEAHARIYGYASPNELIGKSWKTLYEPREIERIEKGVFPIFQKAGQWRGEAVGKRKDGSLFPQEISLTAITGGGLVCVVRDITDRKKAEEALQKSETLMRTVFDAMPQWVFVKDTHSRMLLANKKMASDYGVTPEELVNIPTQDTLLGNEEEKAFFVGVDQQVVSTGEAVEIPEEKITKPDGEARYLHTIKVPLKDSSGKVIGLVGVAQDITERKKAQEELDEYRKHLEELVEARTRELRHSERLAATGRLAASIAHEINNPLQGITTHLEIMHEHFPVDFEKLKNYEFVKSNIEKIRGIVAKLLDTYRGIDEGKTDINMNDIVEKVASLTEHQLNLKNINLKLNLAKNLPSIQGWKQQLHQVLLNLVLNAQDSIKAKKGTITISTFVSDGLVSTAITDTGEGIKERDMDSLFEPFFTTKESGTGLGLFVSQGIIKEHQGLIKVKSELGKGSIFTVTLPIANDNKKSE